jgi:glucose-6-phosphate 1-dehydrogenase
MLSLLKYVSGDLHRQQYIRGDQRGAWQGAAPAHYLAIPPSLFETVIQRLGAAGLAKNARVIVEKPFGRDLASARELNRWRTRCFPKTQSSASITSWARKRS